MILPRLSEGTGRQRRREGKRAGLRLFLGPEEGMAKASAWCQPAPNPYMGRREWRVLRKGRECTLLNKSDHSAKCEECFPCLEFLPVHPLPQPAAVMKTVRQLILGISFLMGFWVIVSFVGVMLNVSNPGFWTTSLMWSLLASVVVMPALVVAHHATTQRPESASQKSPGGSTPPTGEQAPFVDEDEQEDALWPQTEENQASHR